MKCANILFVGMAATNDVLDGCAKQNVEIHTRAGFYCEHFNDKNP